MRREISVGRIVASLVSVMIPIVFFALPQAGCVGRSFTGGSLLQALSSDSAQGIGSFVLFASLSLTAVVIVVGAIGLMSLLGKFSLSPGFFQVIGFLGLAVCFVAIMATKDSSLEGYEAHVESGFWVVLLGFVVLIFSPVIANLSRGVSLHLGDLLSGADETVYSAEEIRNSRGSPGVDRVAEQHSSPQTSVAVESIPLDAGQIAARNAWQAATGSNFIYCRQCGKKSAIWDPADFCGRCGKIRGISALQVQCINSLCNAKIGKEDKYCFKCGSKQPRSDPL